MISSERGGGLLITLAIHLKQNVYFGNWKINYLFVRMPLYHISGWAFGEEHSVSNLKVHKIENYFGSDVEFCVISLLVMFKY